MNKILVITRSLSLTHGQGRYSVEMLKQLSSNFKITVYTAEMPENNSLPEEVLPSIIIKKLPNLEKLTNPFWYFLTTLRMFPSFLEADLVHFFSDYPFCTFFNFIPKFLKPRLITAHGTYAVAPLQRKHSRVMMNLAFKNSKRIVCVSNFTKEKIESLITVKNLMIIPNGIDLGKFSKDSTRNHFGTKNILSVGHLKSRKGYHLSLQAVGLAKKIIPDLHYDIVGNRPDKKYKKELEEIIKEYSLEGAVTFHENLTDQQLVDLYQQTDLFILTPVVLGDKFEGFGLVYLEASALGVPVIGSINCGAQDAINDGQTGYLVDSADINQISGKIIEILTNNALAEQMSSNAKEWVKNFSWEKVGQRYVDLYKEILRK